MTPSNSAVGTNRCKGGEDGEVVGPGRFRTDPSGVEKWFTDLPRARIATEARTLSMWIGEVLEELGYEVIVANGSELRMISRNDRKSDQVDVEKLARYARLEPRSVIRKQAITFDKTTCAYC